MTELFPMPERPSATMMATYALGIAIGLTNAETKQWLSPWEETGFLGLLKPSQLIPFLRASRLPVFLAYLVLAHVPFGGLISALFAIKNSLIFKDEHAEKDQSFALMVGLLTSAAGITIGMGLHHFLPHLGWSAQLGMMLIGSMMTHHVSNRHKIFVAVAA